MFLNRSHGALASADPVAPKGHSLLLNLATAYFHRVAEYLCEHRREKERCKSRHPSYHGRFPYKG